MRPGTLWLSALTALFCFASCNRENEQIKVYRVVKAPLENSTEAAMPSGATASLPDNHPPVGGGASMPATAPQTTSNVPNPPNWQAQPLAQMRKASFLVKGENGAVADISFVTLGAAAGNVLDNVNRWLGQLKQPAVTEEKLKSMVQPLSTARGGVTVVDLSGEPENGDANKDGRIVGAIATDETGTAFFKMRGNAALVAAEKENFLKWVSAWRAVPTNTETSNTTMPAPPTNSDKPQIKWDAPDDWAPAAPSAMRYASFTVEKDGEKADISVVTFSGDGGSDVDNINRWRQQISLPAIGAEVLTSLVAPVHAGEVHIHTVDMSGASARVLAAWTRQGGRGWFFNLNGAPVLVEQEKPKFVAFLQSIRF